MPAPLPTATALAAAIAAGEVRAADAVASSLATIRSQDPDLHAFVEVWEDEALALAAAVDRDRARGVPLPPLAGVPFACKDMFAYAGHLLTCGSRILAGYRSPYTATVVERLLRAGAIPLGRTNTDEFGMGSSTEHSCYGPTRNPIARDRTPGGSSGGSAAAVAAGMCPLALGSDTGGSVRQPAAFCGVLGLKPTYGRISRYGLVAFASSLDTVGLFARAPEDLALMLALVAGEDHADPTSLAAAPPPAQLAPSPWQGLRVGVPREAFAAGLDPQVAACTRAALQAVAQRGAELVDLSLPHHAAAVATYYILCTSEASSNLARYDGVRYGARVAGNDLEATYRATRSAGFGAEVQRRILLGTFALQSGYYAAYYGRAQQARALVRQDYLRALASCDVLAMPTTPQPAFRLGERVADPLAMYLGDTLTVGANLAGVPALSLPCGSTREGLPVGLQLLGKPLAEAHLLGIAAAWLQGQEVHA